MFGALILSIALKRGNKLSCAAMVPLAGEES